MTVDLKALWSAAQKAGMMETRLADLTAVAMAVHLADWLGYPKVARRAASWVLPLVAKMVSQMAGRLAESTAAWMAAWSAHHLAEHLAVMREVLMAVHSADKRADRRAGDLVDAMAAQLVGSKDVHWVDRLAR